MNIKKSYVAAKFVNILGFIRNCTSSFFYGRSKVFTKLRFSASNRMFLKLFFLIPLGIVITFIAYYLLTQMFYYFPDGTGGKEVFLLPRYCLRQNDLSSDIFHQWSQLFFIIVVGVALIYTALYLSGNKKVTLGKYLAVIYIFALILEFLFVLLTPHGFEHLELQAKSINNGIWSGLSSIFDTAKTNHLNRIETIRYIYTDLGSNKSGYTIPGTTHPPGVFLVGIIVFKLATNIFHYLHNAPLAWAITVTLINTLLIVIVALIAREVFSVRIAKLTGIFLLTVPSVLMHFCALFDIPASLFTACGMLVMVKSMKNFRLAALNKDRKKIFLMGILSGLFLMLCAQITYGHAIPISASILAFMVVVDKRDLKNIFVFILGMSIPALIYFIFEYWISNGTSFWLVRAFIISKNVGAGLCGRPYPLSQVANFVVLFVMGGILCLSCTIFMSGCAVCSLWKIIQRRLYISNTRKLCRLFLSYSFILILLFLIFQKSVRLESERTLHWFFVYTWSMSGIFFIAVDIIYRRIFPNLFLRYRKLGLFVFILLQFLITLSLAMGIQDYY